MATHDIHTLADASTARDLAYQVFQQEDFSITPTSDYSATVERGSKTATLLLGAFSGRKKQHIRYDIQVMAAPGTPGNLVRVTSTTTGVAAGAIGVARANDAFNEWCAKVFNALPH